MKLGMEVVKVAHRHLHLQAKWVSGHRGQFFFAFLCVSLSEHFESIRAHFFYSKVFVNAKQIVCISAQPEGVKNKA